MMDNAPRWTAEQAGVMDRQGNPFINLTDQTGTPWIATGVLWYLNECLRGAGLMLLTANGEVLLSLAAPIPVAPHVEKDRANRFIATLKAFGLNEQADRLTGPEGE
jgi:hypothetical protein